MMIKFRTSLVLLALGLLTELSSSAAYQPGSVVAWGNDSQGQCDVSSNLPPVFGITAGLEHSLALRADGKVVGWGDNSAYAATNRPNVSNVAALSAGRNFSVALRRDGTVVAWGTNWKGQTNAPGLNDFVAVSAGDFHALALRANRTVVAWGDNSSPDYASTVPAGATNVIAIAAGWNYSLALKADGRVLAWGYNGQGVLNVPAGLSNVVAIAAGGFQNLALKSNGTVVAWGATAAPVPAGLSNVIAIAAGWGINLALKSDHTVVAWGDGSYGATEVPVGLSNVVKIAAGGGHCLALIAAGPAITSKPPPSVSLGRGGSQDLRVSVLASNSYSCQWYFNGVPIAEATGTNLTITGFDLSKAGLYSITVSNRDGQDTALTLLRLTNSPVVLVDGIDVGAGRVSRIDSAQIALTSTFGPSADVYYTLDGTTPDFTATQYLDVFTLTNTATIRAIAYNATYTDSAEAAPITVQVWPTYALTATTPGGGSIAVSPAAYSSGNRYVSNTVVTLTATPSNGWSFLRWSGDLADTSNVTSIVIDRPRNALAIFGTSLNLFTNGSGRLFLNPPVGPYAFGSTVQLTALPNPGNYFFGWAGIATGFSNPLNIRATNATGLTALFAPLGPSQVSLTALPSGNGTILVSPVKNVFTNGETVMLTAVPAGGSIFSGWSGDASGNLNPLAVTLDTSKLVTGNFVPGTPTNPPVITQSPLSRTMSAGADTVLSFQLTGDGPFSYQWRFNGSSLIDATNPVLALSRVTPAQAGLYDVVVTGPAGTATSAPASIVLFGLQMALGSGQHFPLLTLDGASGLSYRIEAISELTAQSWTLLAPVTLQGGRLYFVDTPPTNSSKRFYRAVPQQ